MKANIFSEHHLLSITIKLFVLKRQFNKQHSNHTEKASDASTPAGERLRLTDHQQLPRYQPNSTSTST
jgi:hypothetical protein